MSMQRELLRNRDAEVAELTVNLQKAQEEISRLETDLQSVTNSTIWRKTEPLRRWKDGKKNEETVTEEQAMVSTFDENTPIEELLYSSIDVIKINHGLLTIDGWVICVEHEMKEAWMILEDTYGIRHQCRLQLSGRRDVADTLGVHYTGDCGIHLLADYHSYSTQKIILKLCIGGNWYELDTRKTIPPCRESGGGDFYFEICNETEPPLDYVRFCDNYLVNCETKADTVDRTGWQADLIVPIYNGMEYLPTLLAGIEKTQVSYRLLLIDDCSPDDRVYPYLKEYADARENVCLLQNESNLGFVKTVNRGLRESRQHVVLVNTDVELPPQWLERLLEPIYTKDHIASVTPFSNSATIFSFPDFGTDNPLFMNLSAEEIDQSFQKLRARYIAVPTGVGFCMAMSRQALDEVGLLDEETFEKGYGEENDWCQRAIDAGYENVYAENLFVYHNHGGSFPSEEKKRLISENGAKLLRKHPNYQMDVEEFCRKDPNREYRSFVKFDLMFYWSAPFVLAFDHDLGGGANAYLEEKLKLELEQGKLVGVVRYNRIADRYRLKVCYRDYEVQIVTRDRTEMMGILNKRTYEQIWINELASYVELEQWLKDISCLRRKSGKMLRLLIHDYFTVCPSLNLMNSKGIYCGLSKEECQGCLAENEYVYNQEITDITKWRMVWADFIKECDEIFVFSQDSMGRMQQIYPEVSKFVLVPHVVEPLRKVVKDKKTDTVNVGILGAISEQKGLNIIKQMVAYLEETQLDMRIVLIGEGAEKLESSVLTVTGRYEKAEIPQLTEENDVDIFFIPSIWPETFSYTTSEIMSMGLPIAVFNLGAPAERVKNYEKGLILQGTDIKIDEIIKQLYNFAKKYDE